MIYMYIFTTVALLISLIVNLEKTKKALKIAWKRFLKITPAFMLMLILVSIMLYALPDEITVKHLGNHNIITGTLLGSLLGSITLMPGFIAFPLSGILLKKGVSYMALSAFSTTLMMVGILTFPIEKEYFGTKLTIIRNVVSYLISIIVAIIIGIAYGEVLM